MKTTITQIAIAEPCSQNWELMEKRDGHNFCAACSKCVIDFSGYSNAEIIKMLSNSSAEVCGRLSQSQLSQLNYHLVVAPINRNWMKYLGVLAIGASVFVQDANAAIPKASEIVKVSKSQPITKKDEPKISRMIYGYIFSKDHKPAVGLKLRLKYTDIRVTTDKNGRYEIKIDDNFDRKLNLLIIENSEYINEFKINFNTSKQNDLYPAKTGDMILGKMIMTSKKG